MSNYGDPDRVEAIASELATASERVRPGPVSIEWHGAAADAFAARAQTWRRECAAAEPAVLAVAEALRAHAAAMRAALARIAADERAARAAAGPDAREHLPAGGGAARPAERWATR
ncbi:hypothetical protein [Embleya sp. NPDC001921]